jgi:AraC family transcriptional regulator
MEALDKHMEALDKLLNSPPLHIVTVREDPIRVVHDSQVVALKLQSGILGLRSGMSPMQRYEYVAGDVVLCRRHFESWVSSKQGIQSVTYEISTAVLQDVADKDDGEVKLQSHWNLTDPRVKALMQALNAERIAGFTTGQLYLDSIEIALADVLVRNYADERIATRQYRDGLPLLRLRRVKDFIEANLSANISLSSLAGESGYSRAHFAKMFRKATGMSPHRYILLRRVEHVRSLLERKDLTLVRIAVSCGFSSQSHMSKVFRDFTGLTPGDVHRHYRTKKSHSQMGG